jgi:hypothetical protein
LLNLKHSFTCVWQQKKKIRMIFLIEMYVIIGTQPTEELLPSHLFNRVVYSFFRLLSSLCYLYYVCFLALIIIEELDGPAVSHSLVG